MIEFRCWHSDAILATSEQPATDVVPQDVLQVDMEDGRVRVMVVHSRTVHLTEIPERTVLRVTVLDVEFEVGEVWLTEEEYGTTAACRAQSVTRQQSFSGRLALAASYCASILSVADAAPELSDTAEWIELLASSRFSRSNRAPVR